MRLYSPLTIATALCILLVSACEDSYTICEQPKQVNYQARFFTRNGAAEVPATPTALTLTFPGATTFIYNQQPNVPLLLLGLSPSADSVKYFIRVNNALPADTMTLFYNNTTQNLGPECGDIMVHNFTRVHTTTNTLDSVKIVAPSVNNVVRENLRIYY
jgi:hypothetical protein